MMDHIGQLQSEDALKMQLLAVAADALTAWHDHLQNWAVTLIANAQMSFENQLAERLDALDTFVEGLGYEESGGVGNLKKS
jgi:hypothetical protein